MFKNKYRIVTDCYCGYEAQVKFWFFPFIYFQMHNNGPVNTFVTEKHAEEFIIKKVNKVVKDVKP